MSAPQGDVLFCKIAVTNGLLQPEQAKHCLDVVLEHQTRNRRKLASIVALEEGFISERDRLRIVEKLLEVEEELLEREEQGQPDTPTTIAFNARPPSGSQTQRYAVFRSDPTSAAEPDPETAPPAPPVAKDQERLPSERPARSATSSARTSRPTLAGYEIIERLGAGKMGTVYKARDLKLGRLVALKVLSAERAATRNGVERFFREAKAAAQLNHTHIVHAYDYGEVDGKHYMTMELVEGETLQDILDREGRLSEAQAIEVGIAMADALTAAERAAIVHRDIKPSNIIIGRGPPAAIKLSDLGIAKLNAGEESALTQDGHGVGTPYYMSPEQCLGKPVDTRTDIYALGATLFHLVAGRPPFDGDTPAAIIAQHVMQTPPALRVVAREASAELEKVIACMLEKTPRQRYAGAEALLQDLRQLQEGRSPAHAAAAALAASRRGPLARGTTTTKSARAPAPRASATAGATSGRRRAASGRAASGRAVPTTRVASPAKMLAVTLAGAALVLGGALWFALKRGNAGGPPPGDPHRRDRTAGHDLTPPENLDDVAAGLQQSPAEFNLDRLHRRLREQPDLPLEDRIAAYRYYLEQFPDAPIAAVAREELAELEAQAAQASGDALQPVHAAAQAKVEAGKLAEALEVYDRALAQVSNDAAEEALKAARQEIQERLERRYRHDREKAEALIRKDDYTEAVRVLDAIIDYGSEPMRAWAGKERGAIAKFAKLDERAAAQSPATGRDERYLAMFRSVTERLRALDRRGAAEAVDAFQRAGGYEPPVQAQLELDRRALALLDELHEDALRGIAALGEKEYEFRLKGGTARGKVQGTRDGRVTLQLAHGQRSFALEELETDDLLHFARQALRDDRGAYLLKLAVFQLYRGDGAGARAQLQRAREAGADTGEFERKQVFVAPVTG